MWAIHFEGTGTDYYKPLKYASASGEEKLGFN